VAVTLQKRPQLAQSLALNQAQRPLPRIRLQAQVLPIQAQALRQVLRLLLLRLLRLRLLL
jgi:hypothetical protein